MLFCAVRKKKYFPRTIQVYKIFNPSEFKVSCLSVTLAIELNF